MVLDETQAHHGNRFSLRLWSHCGFHPRPRELKAGEVEAFPSDTEQRSRARPSLSRVASDQFRSKRAS